MTRHQTQEVHVRPFPGGREADGAAIALPNSLLVDSDPCLLGIRGHSEFTEAMSDLHREQGFYRKEFGFPREDASL
jgi:hypothetical protein